MLQLSLVVVLVALTEQAVVAQEDIGLFLAKLFVDQLITLLQLEQAVLAELEMEHLELIQV
tara:strand:+ start:94 stop:276 length:183 start_codon:yes stop_codon:yes gene_type:complete